MNQGKGEIKHDQNKRIVLKIKESPKVEII